MYFCVIIYRKDTIKACIYVKELVRFIWWRAKLNEELGMRNEETTFGGRRESQCIFNCCFEPAYTIEHIVGAMKKLAGCGYKGQVVV